MLASQTQGSDTQARQLDPQGNRFASSIDSVSGITITNDYADNSDRPELATGSNGGWIRNITTPSGLVAEVTPTGTTLELPSLHDDIMATVVTASESVTGTFTYSEFGAVESTSSSPGTYGYLGGDQRSAAALGGSILMGARGYSPNLGRFDQTDPVQGGNANSYDYSNQNPITQADPTGDSVRADYPSGQVSGLMAV